MRYQAFSVDFLKSKAKLLKKYICHPLMEAPALSLTDVQQIIARGLGFSGWSELLPAQEGCSQSRPVLVPDAVFQQLVAELAHAICRSQDLCASLIFRVGFCPENCDLSLHAQSLAITERELLVDVLIDRMVELERGSAALMAARDRLLALYRVLASESARSFDNRLISLDLYKPSSPEHQRNTLMEWINASTSIFTNEDDLLLERNVHEVFKPNPELWKRTYHWLPHQRLVAPFVSGLIPRKGLLVMTGGNGSGRTFTSILLSLCNRRFDREMFSLFLRNYTDPFDGPSPAGYVGELIREKDLAPLVRDAEDKLVIVQLGAGGPEGAYYRTRQALVRIMGGKADDWIRDNFIGGYHHDFHYAADRNAIRESRVNFWRAKDARYIDAAKETVRVEGFLSL